MRTLSLAQARAAASILGYQETGSDPAGLLLFVSDPRPGVVPDLFVLGFENGRTEIPEEQFIRVLEFNGNPRAVVAAAITEARGGR